LKNTFKEVIHFIDATFIRNKKQEKNLKLIKEYDPNIPEVIVGDPIRLHQIVLNWLVMQSNLHQKEKSLSVCV
jgi:nitrogen-specific signal transduction histidine kinase